MGRTPKNNGIPDELITHYIVKDYQRMFAEYGCLEDEIARLRRENDMLRHLNDLLRRRLASSAEKQRNVIGAFQDYINGKKRMKGGNHEL